MCVCVYVCMYVCIYLLNFDHEINIQQYVYQQIFIYSCHILKLNHINEHALIAALRSSLFRG